MDVNFIFKIAAIGIIVAVLNQLLTRSGREEYAMITTLAGLVVVLMMIVPQIGNLFQYIKSIFGLNDMDIVKIVAIAIVCALLCAVLKQYKPEFAIVVQLAASVFILLLIASAMGDLISAVKDLINGSGINTEYLTLLLKALGVSVLTQLAADACRDSGETALSNKVELAGKVTILLLCLPLVKAMIQLSAGLIKG